jgi:tetratricopeptide (TPR) repeat protein
MSAARPASCAVHPNEIAGWRCDHACAHYLCGTCTARLINMYTCCACGAPARQLTYARKSRSFGHWLAVAALAPVGRALPGLAISALLLGAVAFVAATVESNPHQLDDVAAAARFAVLGIYALIVVDGAARGSEVGLALRLARGLVATMIVWVPAAAYLWFVGAPGKAAPHDPMLWLYAGLALSYLPIALAVAATDASFAEAANPFKVFDLAGRLGRHYLATLTVVVLLLGAIGLGASATAQLRTTIHVPVVRDAVALLPMLIALTILGQVIGLVTYVHGDVLGWGHEQQYRDPLFPRMRAEGRRKVVASAEAAPATAEGAAPITTEGAVPVSPAERAEAAKLADALRGENLQRALRIYEARASWSADTVDDRQLVGLARAATRAKRFDLATRLLETAHGRNGRAASQALLALAQLHGDALGQPAQAMEIYRQVAERYPGSDAAKVAAQKLKG